eukprot:3373366-Pleurochrysis_carterae.AAC.1
MCPLATVEKLSWLASSPLESRTRRSRTLPGSSSGAAGATQVTDVRSRCTMAAARANVPNAHCGAAGSRSALGRRRWSATRPWTSTADGSIVRVATDATASGTAPKMSRHCTTTCTIIDHARASNALRVNLAFISARKLLLDRFLQLQLGSLLF